MYSAIFQAVCKHTTQVRGAGQRRNQRTKNEWSDWKRTVFSSFLKASRFGNCSKPLRPGPTEEVQTTERSRRACGRRFHNLGANTEKAVECKVVLATRTCRSFCVEERSDLGAEYGLRSEWRYQGWPQAMVLNVISAALKLILCSTGSQWREFSRGVAEARPLEPVTILVPG